MTIATLGIDLGKTLNSVVGMDATGRVVLRRRVRRTTLKKRAASLPPCVVAMEACCGAHHVGRLFAVHGHTVRQISPEYVRPCGRAQKNDDDDAAGIAEAATWPTMRVVELERQDRLDLQTLHRARSRLLAARKTPINQLRAILPGCGHVFRQGRAVLEREIDRLPADPPADLPARMLTLVASCAPSGARWTRGWTASTGTSRPTPARTMPRTGWCRRPASACSAPPRWWPPSATAMRSAARGTCPPRSAWFQDG